MESIKDLNVSYFVEGPTEIVETLLKIVYSQSELEIKADNTQNLNAEMKEIITSLHAIDNSLVNLRNRYFNLCHYVTTSHKKMIIENQTLSENYKKELIDVIDNFQTKSLENFRSTINVNRNQFTDDMLSLANLLVK